MRKIITIITAIIVAPILLSVASANAQQKSDPVVDMFLGSLAVVLDPERTPAGRAPSKRRIKQFCIEFVGDKKYYEPDVGPGTQRLIIMGCRLAEEWDL